jgi:glycosyltransferase involved in cell wall biosynthesis
MIGGRRGGHFKAGLHVVHVISGLERGGAETVLTRMLPRLRHTGQEHVVVSLSGEGPMAPRLRKAGIPVAALGMASWWGRAGALVRLWRLVRAIRPDAVQGWMYHGNLGAVAARSLAPGRPALLWNVRHSLDDVANEKPMTRRVIRANARLSRWPGTILYNSGVARRQHEAFGFEPSRGRVIPNGFDLEALQPDPDAGRAVRRELGIPEKATVIGNVARFHPMKNHAGLLAAARELAASDPGLHLVLAGPGVTCDTPALGEARTGPLADRLHLLGERENITALMNAFDLFCLPSAWGEAFPNAVGEAMACGVPCVATDVGDARELIGAAGRVVPAGDAAALTGALRELLALPAAERRALGGEARERIAEHFSLDFVAGRYRDLYLAAGGEA